MSHIISIEVSTLSGQTQIYDVDSGDKIINLIKHIITTHKSLSDPKAFQANFVDLKTTKFIYNGKTLDNQKTLEDYTEFQFKSENAYKIHLIIRGGHGHAHDTTNEDASCFSQSSKPIPINMLHHKSGSNSCPGTSSFLENQINRLDTRQRSASIINVSESFVEISEQLKGLTSHNPNQSPISKEKLDKITQLLASIDLKLTTIIEFGPPTPIGPNRYKRHPHGSPIEQSTPSPIGQFSFSPPKFSLINPNSPSL